MSYNELKKLTVKEFFILVVDTEKRNADSRP